MNSEQEKQYIVEQRAMGQSFTQIAQSLGKKANTVRKTFYRVMGDDPGRMEAVENAPDAQTAHPALNARCKYCGNTLTKVPKGAKRMFCSNKCRDAWWNEKKASQLYQLTCENCGVSFISKGNAHKRFCSRKCYVDSAKKLKAVKESRVIDGW